METPFNGNPKFGPEEVLTLKEKYNISTVIETGTFKGSTTIWFAENFENVITIESNQKYLNNCLPKFKNHKNIKAVLGNSGTELIKYIPPTGVVLFYLDAHWGNYWPLLDELKQISRAAKDRCVIIVDDFKVEGRDDISYDEYKEKALDWDFVKAGILQCYSPESFSKRVYAPPPDLAKSRGRLIVEPATSV